MPAGFGWNPSAEALVWIALMLFGLYIQLRLRRRARRDIVWFDTRCQEAPRGIEKTLCEDAVVVASGHLHSAWRHIGLMCCGLLLGLSSLFILPPQRPSEAVYQHVFSWLFIVFVGGFLDWDGYANLRSREHFRHIDNRK